MIVPDPASIWNSLNTQDDLEGLLTLFGDFHDSCLREAHIWAGYYVYPNLDMQTAGDLDSNIRLFVQRQYRAPSAIELLFEEVITCHWQRANNHDPIIYDATLIYREGVFYWADAGSWSPEDNDRDKMTWIAAKRISWRDVSDWMGGELRYGRNKSP